MQMFCVPFFFFFFFFCCICSFFSFILSTILSFLNPCTIEGSSIGHFEEQADDYLLRKASNRTYRWIRSLPRSIETFPVHLSSWSTAHTFLGVQRRSKKSKNGCNLIALTPNLSFFIYSKHHNKDLMTSKDVFQTLVRGFYFGIGSCRSTTHKMKRNEPVVSCSPFVLRSTIMATLLIMRSRIFILPVVLSLWSLKSRHSLYSIDSNEVMLY